MKPHEETWYAEDCEVWRSGHADPTPGDDALIACVSEEEAEYYDAAGRAIRDRIDEARAALIAKAPEMARMLLAREWSRYDPYCESCGNNSAHPHRDDCAWLALMRAIGAR